MESRISLNMEKLSHLFNNSLYLLLVVSFLLGNHVSFYFHFLTVTFFLLILINIYYLYIQKQHALLSNFGLLAQIRYMVESVGPEFRQYLFMSDTEERPFTRIERNEIYRKAKNVDSSAAFGSQLNFDHTEIKLRHSMYPMDKSRLRPFELVFGEERALARSHVITKPLMISAMSYGTLGSHAVRALARGARKAGITMNTGEGGFPKYHLMENCDLVFQMGTAKFGVRHEDGTLDDDKLEKLAALEQIKMIEIKFSQGAKPGKGGLLPREKITEEIALLRGVPMDRDVVSPAYHAECTSPEASVKFIRHVQEVAQLPVGIKMCLGRPDELGALLREMKAQLVFPDYMVIDGAEGGTGAAPKAFMDDFGLPLFTALPLVEKLLREEGVRNRLKLLSSGKLIHAGRQFTALSLGTDAIYTARGFLLAIGCIQSLQCNNNTCPVGITTQDPALQKGLDIEQKSQRVANYVNNLWHDHREMLAAMGKTTHRQLNPDNVYIPQPF